MQPAIRVTELTKSIDTGTHRVDIPKGLTLDHYRVQLSGREQQRVALAQPSILMADEPTGNLNSANGQQILELPVGLNKQEKTTLVLVTRDRELAANADRVVMLNDGRVVSDGLPS